jgi:hypothetical protein
MKSVIISLLALVCFTATTNAQVKKTLKKVIELKMPKTVDDDMPGTRGANVAYNPVAKKYYAAFAGNAGYPLAVFDIKGNRLSDENLATEADLRGLWYNPTTKTLQGNCYSEGGWVSYKLDAKGMTKSPTYLLEGMYQPSDQSVGVYEVSSKTIYFLKDNTLIGYNAKGEEGRTIELTIVKGENDLEEDLLPARYNYTTAISTGLPKMEFGLYDTQAKTIELYNKANGKKTATWQLPDDLPTTENTGFNFSYCNGIVWLFDIDNRTWLGYK